MHAIQKADSVSAPDSTVNYTVGKIAISGNHKTKSFIILREIPFSEGEDYSLKDLVGKFEDARRQLMNTSLFHSAVVAVKEFEGFKVNILIEVKERWYLFPAPFFKPVDRNLNQWIVEQKAKLNRVNFGLRLHYYNITGVNDKLSGIVGVGYTKQFSLKYDRLYFDKKLKWGFTIGFSTGKNKEVNYNTINDKQVFIKDDNTFLGNFTNAFALLTYRRKIKTRHSFGLAYSSSKIGDTVLSLNPSYFKTGIQKISYPELFYNLSYFDVDFIPYPTKGYTAQFTFTKKGFSDAINLWQFVIKGSGSWHMGAKSFFNINLFTTVKLPSGQSYFNRQLLGYGDAYMQGYEYYVIDGVAGGFLKAGYHHDLFNFNIRIPPVKKGKEAQHIPFRIVGKLYGNTGYVHNPQPGDNGLSNKMLYSGGFGIDIVTFYDLTLKLEYSFNQLGENGLFLHRKSIF
ncbi:MAG: hypothetical protein HZB42_15130 [Sphingobacteriales bacterium]|nr:hypothetical protein [Sphingobacteriales bacterium]